MKCDAFRKTFVVLFAPALVASLTPAANAAVTYTSRNSLVKAVANSSTDQKSTTAFGAYDATAQISSTVGDGAGHTLSSNAITRQASDLTATGITLFGHSEGMTGWNSRTATSASFQNTLSVDFALDQLTAYTFAANGGWNPLDASVSIVITDLTHNTQLINWTSGNATSTSGTFAAGNYRFAFAWTQFVSSGAPLGPPDVNASLTLTPAPGGLGVLGGAGLLIRRKRR